MCESVVNSKYLCEPGTISAKYEYFAINEELCLAVTENLKSKEHRMN